MFKTSFRLWFFLVIILTIIWTGCLYSVCMMVFGRSNVDLFEMLMLCFFVFVWLWLFFGELRTKAILVTLESETISKRSFLGLGPEKKYSLHEFEGFSTCSIPAKGGEYEYLYLIKNGKKVIKLSEFYHSNYDQIKEEIRQRLKSLGTVKFSYISEFKEIFM